MSSTRQAPERPAPTPTSKPVTFGSALIAALALAACSTEDVHPDVTIIGNGSSDTPITAYVSRDDAYNVDLTPSNLPPYRVQVDGRYLAYDHSQFVLAGSNGSVSFTVPAGEHVVSLVDDQGHTAVTSSTVETKPGFDPAHPELIPVVLFFGGPTTMRAQVFIDDPATVPAGSVHVRVMNAFVDHQPLQVVQCPTALDGSRPYAGGECTPVGAPITHGNLYEADATPDVVAKLGFYWAAPGAVAPVVAPVNLGNLTLTSGFVTRVPLQVLGPQSTCPTCLFTEF